MSGRLLRPLHLSRAWAEKDVVIDVVWEMSQCETSQMEAEGREPAKGIR